LRPDEGRLAVINSADELAELFGHTVDLVSLHVLHPLSQPSVDGVIVTVTATGELDITTAPGLMEAY
jgi:predicted nucleotidyltransferase